MLNAFVRLLVTVAKKPPSPTRNMAWVGVGIVAFFFVSPWVLGVGSRRLVAALTPFVRQIEVAAGTLALVGGMALGLWTLLAQWHLGKGTPAPNQPTRYLVTAGPYAFCRNPIMLAATVYHFGFGTLLFGLLPGVLAAGGILTLGALYTKLVEERELEARFGEPYRQYRSRTPFLIPRRPKP